MGNHEELDDEYALILIYHIPSGEAYAVYQHPTRGWLAYGPLRQVEDKYFAGAEHIATIEDIDNLLSNQPNEDIEADGAWPWDETERGHTA